MSTNTAAPPLQSPTSVCQHWPRSNCKLGYLCPNPHVGPGAIHHLAPSAFEALSFKPFQHCRNHLTIGCPLSDETCKFEHISRDELKRHSIELAELEKSRLRNETAPAFAGGVVNTKTSAAREIVPVVAAVVPRKVSSSSSSTGGADGGGVPQQRDGGDNVCKNFKNSICHFGALCYNSHAGFGRVAPGAVTEFDARAYLHTKHCRTFMLYGKCSAGDKCLKQHITRKELHELALQQQQTKNYGNDDGAHHPRGHEEADGTTPTTAQQQQQQQQQQQRQERRGPESKLREVVCQDWRSSPGGCAYGYLCKQPHRGEGRIAEGAVSEVQVRAFVKGVHCRLFLTNMGCQNGDQCRWVHATGADLLSRALDPAFVPPRYSTAQPFLQSNNNNNNNNNNAAGSAGGSGGANSRGSNNSLPVGDDHQRTSITSTSGGSSDMSVCRHWSGASGTAGCCYGYACPNMHVRTGKIAPGAPTEHQMRAFDQKTMCKWFLWGKCIRGDACGCRHVGTMQLQAMADATDSSPSASAAAAPVPARRHGDHPAAQHELCSNLTAAEATTTSLPTRRSRPMAPEVGSASYDSGNNHHFGLHAATVLQPQHQQHQHHQQHELQHQQPLFDAPLLDAPGQHNSFFVPPPHQHQQQVFQQSAYQQLMLLQQQQQQLIAEQQIAQQQIPAEPSSSSLYNSLDYTSPLEVPPPLLVVSGTPRFRRVGVSPVKFPPPIVMMSNSVVGQQQSGGDDAVGALEKI